MAACIGKTDVVIRLLVKGASVDTPDNEGNTAIALAQEEGQTDIVNLLRSLAATDPSDPHATRILIAVEQTFGPYHPRMILSLNTLAADAHDRARIAEADSLYRRAGVLSVLITLRRLQEEDGEGNFAIVTANQDENSYVQFAGGPGDSVLYTELGHGKILDPTQIAKLEQTMEWKLPGSEGNDTPNYYRNWTAVNDEDRFRIAGQVIHTLEDIFDLTLRQPLDIYLQTDITIREDLSRGEKALQTAEQELGPVHPDVAAILTNMAGLHSYLKEHDRAELLLKRAVAIYEEDQGADLAAAAQPFNDLAYLYLEQGKFTLAEPLYLHALSIYKQLSGPYDPMAANIMFNLAYLYSQTDRPDEAKQMEEEAQTLQGEEQ